MSSRAMWVLVAAAACGRPEPVSRARVLATIPATAAVIVAADGHALAHPRIRGVLDVVRPELPVALGCVLDAALASEHVAAGLARDGAMTIAIATRARVTCPALSRIADGLWVATLGGGPVTADASVLAIDELARARPYLVDGRRAPIAAAIALPGALALATARPDPLQAWLAIDTRGVAPDAMREQVAAAVRALAGAPEVAPFAEHIELALEGSQVIARLDRAVPADLAVAVRAVIAWRRAQQAPAASAFACPPPATTPPCTPPCTPHCVVAVASPAAAIDPQVIARGEPVVVNGVFEGLRVRDDLAAIGLTTGDVITAIDGRRLRSHAHLVELLGAARGKMSLAVTRGRQVATIDLVAVER